MRIDLNPKAPELQDTGKAVRGKTPKPGTPASTTQDEASISSKAARVDQLEKHINQLPEIREAKVEPLRAAVQSGRYSVSSAKIAEAMFSAMISQG